MSDLYSKQEISQLLHVSYKTLRGYEDKGLITPAHINEENGYKYYNGNQIYTIDMIRYCNQDLGIPLNEIKEIIGNNNQKEKLISLLLEKKHNAESMIKKISKDYRNMDSLTVYSDGRKVAQQLYELLEDTCLNFVFNSRNAKGFFSREIPLYTIQ